MSMPTFAIIGRPNVGKSTLFNRLAKSDRALTHDRPGVTRDRVMVRAPLGGITCQLIDTGGLTLAGGGEMEMHIAEQAQLAVEEAQAIIFVVDAREGMTASDLEIAEILRGHDKPVQLVVNKVDGAERADEWSADFHSLGFPLQAVSASHGFGIGELAEALALIAERVAPDLEDEEDFDPRLRLTVLGRPNAGKSSLINALAGEKRLIVSDEAGTTRDTVDVPFVYSGVPYVFVDTAGVRRRSKIDDGLERLSVMRALGATKGADVAVMAIDLSQGLAVQDKKLLALLDKQKTPLVVAATKLDLIARDQRSAVRKDLREALRMCSHVPVIYTSSIKKLGLADLLAAAASVKEEGQTRIGTGMLNRAMREVLAKHQAPMVQGRRAKFYYLTQTETAPPTFVCFVSDPKRVAASYVTYLEKQLRKIFGFIHTPIRLKLKPSHGEKEETGSEKHLRRAAPKKPRERERKGTSKEVNLDTSTAEGLPKSPSAVAAKDKPTGRTRGAPKDTKPTGRGKGAPKGSTSGGRKKEPSVKRVPGSPRKSAPKKSK